MCPLQPLRHIKGSTICSVFQHISVPIASCCSLGKQELRCLLSITVHPPVLPAATAMLTAELLWPLPMR